MAIIPGLGRLSQRVVIFEADLASLGPVKAMC